MKTPYPLKLVEAKLSCNPTLMNPFLMAEMERFVRYVQSEFIITSDYREGDKGDHGRGDAVDIMFVNSNHSLLDIYLMAERFSFNAIGVYPDWKYKYKNLGGFHLGYRKVVLCGARWMRVGSKDYIPLNEVNIKKYLI